MSSPLFRANSVSIDPYVQGDVAAGTADSGNPIKIGGIASVSVPTAVSNGQRVAAYFDAQGYLYTKDIVQGDVASGSTDSGNPLKIGGVASASIPTGVVAGQRVAAYFDLNGRQHVVVDGSASSVQLLGQYSSSTPTLSNGQIYSVQLDASANSRVAEQNAAGAEDNTNNVFAMIERLLATSTYSPSSTQSNSFTTTNLKASPGNLYGFIVTNTTGSNRYLQFHNTATTPGGGATALYKFLVPAGAMLVLGAKDWGGPLYFSTGMAYANSTAASTYTAGTAGDLILDAQYK